MKKYLLMTSIPLIGIGGLTTTILATSCSPKNPKPKADEKYSFSADKNHWSIRDIPNGTNIKGWHLYVAVVNTVPFQKNEGAWLISNSNEKIGYGFSQNKDGSDSTIIGCVSMSNPDNITCCYNNNSGTDTGLWGMTSNNSNYSINYEDVDNGWYIFDIYTDFIIANKTTPFNNDLVNGVSNMYLSSVYF